jgi:hypothetical protein
MANRRNIREYFEDWTSQFNTEIETEGGVLKPLLNKILTLQLSALLFDMFLI